MAKTKEYRNGRNELHREDGPAVIEYDAEGKLKRETYYSNGSIHSEDGPALIDYYENNGVKREAYYIGGELHAEVGPAIIEFDRDGCPESGRWFRHGKEFIPSPDQVDAYMILRDDMGMTVGTMVCPTIPAEQHEDTRMSPEWFCT